jgi:hypothetical protein
MRTTRYLLAVGVSAAAFALAACGSLSLGDRHSADGATRLAAGSSSAAPSQTDTVVEATSDATLPDTVATTDPVAVATTTSNTMHMPNLIGLTSAEAVQAIHALATDGVYPLVRVGPTACYPDLARAGRVFAQSPAAGAPIDTMRTTIEWRVYLAPGESAPCDDSHAPSST